MTIDPTPRTNAELPPRYPEAAEIARLRAALDAAKADVVDFSEIAAALVEEMSKKTGTTWGQVKAAIRALGDLGDRHSHRLLSDRLDAMTAERDEYEAKLKSVLDRESAAYARYDAKLDTAEAERDAPLTPAEAVVRCPEVSAAFRALQSAQESIATFMGVHGYPKDSGAGLVLDEVSAALAALTGEPQP